MRRRSADIAIILILYIGINFLDMTARVRPSACANKNLLKAGIRCPQLELVDCGTLLAFDIAWADGCLAWIEERSYRPTNIAQTLKNTSTVG